MEANQGGTEGQAKCQEAPLLPQGRRRDWKDLPLQPGDCLPEVSGSGSSNNGESMGCLWKLCQWCSFPGSFQASTGIAALLLEGGRTAHSTFYTPTDELRLHEPPRINYESEEAKKIREARAIIIDEVTMLNADAFDHINETVKSVMPIGQRELSFGGKVVLISGDWKQLLPVVEGAANERLESVASCIKQSPLYHEFETLRLTQNMRVDRPDQARWREFIYGVGTGRNYLTINGKPTLLTEVPDEVCVDSMEELAEFCFPQTALDDPVTSTFSTEGAPLAET